LVTPSQLRESLVTRVHIRTRRALAAFGATAVVAATLLAPSPVQAAPGHGTLVSEVPSPLSPDVVDGAVTAIYDAGSKILAGGSFTTVQDRDSDVNIPRNYLVAFDKATGAVDAAFTAVVDAEVMAIAAGPTAGTAYIAGRFNTVNGTTRRKVALINVADGSLVTTFAPPAFNALIADIAPAGGRLLVGGHFTAAGAANPRGGLASLNATTGRLDPYLTTSLTVNHNWTAALGGAKAPIGVENMAISPDGTQLVVIGNFKNADGVLHDQVVKLDLGAEAATIANWNTDRYTPRCAYRAFDSYVRDVAFSPDGAYFVIVTTGAPNSGTLCDSAARWTAGAVGAGQQPTWVDYAGGDTLLSVAISEQAIYVGGHMRWMNNSLGSDRAQAGAVGRASIAALDPISGLPLSWNPGKHPRGYGVDEMYLTPDGLWLGSDQPFIGNFEYRRERIAFFPLAGGAPVHPTTTASLPGNVYQLGVAASSGGGEPLPPTVLHRVNAGGAAITATDGGPNWTSDSGTNNPLRNSGSSKSTNTTVQTVDSTVPAGTPQSVFHSLRYDPAGGVEMQWNFAATAGKTLEVRLYFADPCACTNQPGERLFDVTIDGTTRLDDFDIVAATGSNRGTMRSFEITSDGNVDIDFLHGAVHNPMVNGFEILQQNVAPPVGGNNGIAKRSYDGASTVGAATVVTNPDTTTWSTSRGAFWVGGTVFYGMSGNLYRRTFDGTSFGPVSAVDPYHDPEWDTVLTDSGTTTYAGVTSNFYSEINNVTGMFYSGGRLYYTLTNQNGLFWRWFTPDSGAVGADKFTVAGATGFSTAGAVFVSGGFLYVTHRTAGTLSRMAWTGTAPSGVATVVSGPAVNGVDWRAGATFVGP
jgi:hypothetical protein